METNKVIKWDKAFANEVYKDVVKTFGIIKDPLKSDATYISPTGKIIDTKGPFQNHQHENIAKYISDKYGYDDLDDSNGSKFMTRIIGSIRVTTWLKAIYIPEKQITDNQIPVLKDLIKNLKISKQRPLMVSNLLGTQFVEFISANSEELINEIIAVIMDYYVTRRLA